jgi:hypothetical protein
MTAWEDHRMASMSAVSVTASAHLERSISRSQPPRTIFIEAAANLDPSAIT